MCCSVSPELGDRSMEKALEEGKLLQGGLCVRETLETVCSAQLSIAVTEDSGNGVSSFVNVLRGLGHEEETSAPTGVVRTIQSPTSYSSSCLPTVMPWDLPGMGAAAQSLENHLGEMPFSQYDLFIITASEQFSMNHVRLAKTIQGLGKRFSIVWTKLDRDLSTSVLSEDQLLQNIRGNIWENLQKRGICEPPTFLVSNHDPLLHDFPWLRDTLYRDLSDIRCCSPLQTLSQICHKIVNDKVTSLQEKISSGFSQDTLGIQDADDLGECLDAYRLLFGVDDGSLQQVAQSVGKSVEEFRAAMKSQDLPTLCRADWRLSFMTCVVMKAVLSTLPTYIPVLGDLVIHYFRRMKHRCILDVVAEDTKAVLRKVLTSMKADLAIVP
ncbi:LOW QUALITY PROTEIN: immunity-related GTPase family M protein-like [Manis javanica]|uniref:LOW QUALITY PROTEIN: immunity-related GTPase family M protein-like n=1 Tax=Manis javanica TaxID=9974 RepID=UPI003C6DA4D3